MSVKIFDDYLSKFLVLQSEIGLKILEIFLVAMLAIYSYSSFVKRIRVNMLPFCSFGQ